MRRYALALFLSATLPSYVESQVCRGGPALAGVAAGNVGGTVSFFDGGKSFGASATFGSEFFGTAGFTYSDFDDTDLSLKSLGARAGYEIAPSASRVRLCPTASIAYGFGLEVLGVDVTTLGLAPALSVGIEAVVSPTVTVIPAAELGLAYQRISVDAGPLGEETESETDGFLVLALGVVFNQRFAVGPAVSIPIASDGGDTTFGIGLAVAVGSGG
jgi:hypothetical protein